ncbi:MAG: carbon storage regulator CsrA [Planctomycetes bacterium]|nr:carbon storage regulator CsrA [Planctomycetota bacterium]
MLVLSRQKEETIMIGDDVEITIVDIRGDKVRLGITAPPHIPVHRKEVYEAIQRENRASANLRPDEIPRVGSLAKRREKPAKEPPAKEPPAKEPPTKPDETSH